MILEALLQSFHETVDPNPSVHELQRMFLAGQAVSDGYGQLLAKDAANTFRMRQQTTERTNADTNGFADVITALKQRSPDEAITLFHFTAEDGIFTVFVSSLDEILGCIRVTRKG